MRLDQVLDDDVVAVLAREKIETVQQLLTADRSVVDELAWEMDAVAQRAAGGVHAEEDDGSSAWSGGERWISAAVTGMLRARDKRVTSALELSRTRAMARGLTLGDAALDGLLGGRGLTIGGLHEIVGPSATGKTQLCVQLLLNVMRPESAGGLDGKAVYVCTEGNTDTAIRRLEQMAGAAGLTGWNEAVLVEHCMTLEEQWNVISNRLPVLMAREDVRLVVVDSIAALVRSDFDASEAMRRSEWLFGHATRLKRLAARHDAVIVVTNQVRADMSATAVLASGDDPVQPALGLSWTNCVTSRLCTARRSSSTSADGIRRTLAVAFAPHVPPAVVPFTISARGVHGVADALDE